MNKMNLQCQFCLAGHMALLSELSDTDLGNLAANKSKITYKKGQVLFYQGTIPLGIFCVHSGKVKISRVGPDEKEQILSIAKENDFLGYRSLLSEDEYSVTATVSEEATICFIPKDDFLTVLKSNPLFMEKVLKLVCGELGIVEQKLSQFIGKNVRERLAATLLMLKETYGMDGQISEPIAINLTRRDIANIIGSTTETVIRIISEFKDEGLIEMDSRKIRVVNPLQLAHEANLYD